MKVIICCPMLLIIKNGFNKFKAKETLTNVHKNKFCLGHILLFES